MAGLHNSLRPTSASSSSLSQSSQHAFTSRLLLLLTLLPLTLACFAFILQWRGGLNDPVTRWSPDRHEFPGMTNHISVEPVHSSHSDCSSVLGQSRTPAFPYFGDWKLDHGSDLRPKVIVAGGFRWVMFECVMLLIWFFPLDLIGLCFGELFHLSWSLLYWVMIFLCMYII